MISDLEALQSASSALVAAVGRLDPGALDRPTPCDEWTVTQLLDHVTGGNRFTISILAGVSGTDAMPAAIDSFGDGGPGRSDAATALLGSTRDQLAAFDQVGVFDRTCDHVVGTISAADVIRLRVHDLALHTWDLNQALDAGLGFEPSMIAWCCEELSRPDSLTARSLDLEGSAPTDVEGLLTAFGRDGSLAS